MTELEFKNPELLWLLLLLPLLGFWLFYKHKKSRAEVRFPQASEIARYSQNWLARFSGVLHVLRLLALALIIIAIARPRTSDENVRSNSTRGIDIMMAVDISASMLARDFSPNRLEATKDVAHEFIEERTTDRVGLVIYSGESFTKTPLTSDQNVLLSSLKEVEHGMVQDGTAIGMALATSVNRLKDSRADSKVVILLSDGENNAGNIDPQTAAGLAQKFNVRVYTIGVGSRGMAEVPVAYDAQNNFIYRRRQVNIDEKLLTDIAEQTGGRYFRATNSDKLKAIYKEIDKMEKTELEEIKYLTYDEKFDYFVIAGLLLFGLEVILRYSIYKSTV